MDPGKLHLPIGHGQFLFGRHGSVVQGWRRARVISPCEEQHLKRQISCKRLYAHRNGKVKLPDDARVTAYPFNPLRLFFDQVRSEDQGWYLCRVGNAKGVATGVTYLKVDPNPAGRPSTPEPLPEPVTEQPPTRQDKLHRVSVPTSNPSNCRQTLLF